MKYKIGDKFSFKLKTDDFWRDVTLTDVNDRYIELKSLSDTGYGGHFEVDKCDFRDLPAKTVLDAVIEFKGEWPFSTRFMCIPSDDNDVATQGRMKPSDSKYTNEYWVGVCSRNEFNTLVDELASNFSKCDISYQEHCENETIRLEGDEMKTVTHEGNGYQIGGLYVGYNNSLIKLKEVRNGEFLGVDVSGNEYQDDWIMPVNKTDFKDCPIGTIIEAPVELIDGECYQFTAPSGIVRKGYFIPVKRLFICADGNIDVDRCTNIKLLTVA